jgi:hypothetical protein
MAPLSANPPVPAGVANYGHEFYSRIFELLLRLKGNYLWPAMWNNAFNEDDSLNAALADEYGIVMGNSHQEPMLRAQKEWDRRYISTLGNWNWTRHSDTLAKFWREGIRRNRKFESIITIGLRGADDTEMGPGGPQANIDKLEKIVSIQRNILAEELNQDVTKIPQLWCLYKEVLDYYNAGMRVPDDVTLLWAEDNWGNLRRVPTAAERNRAGGAGIYYHFDYHGGPRSYQWINTNPIPKIWDQMSLAKQYGADRIWIVNVGHFRGYEFPMEYFLSLAWNPGDQNSVSLKDMKGFTERWAERTFGPTYAGDIADIISKTTRYNGRRKPELLSPSTYSLVNYGEAEKVVTDFRMLAEKAEKTGSLLPVDMHDSFYHLVLFPVKASSIVNELYFTAGKNALYAKEGRALTNEMAEKTELLFRADTSLMGYYNREYAGGKWNHFMDQTHLGYKSWVDPPVNSLDALHLYRIQIPETADMGIALEGTEDVWPGSGESAALPSYDVFNRQERYLEIFNKGRQPFSFSVKGDQPWILVTDTSGTISTEKRITVKIDWDKLPSGTQRGNVKINGAGSQVMVSVSAFNPGSQQIRGFVEADGYVSIEAQHFTAVNNTNDRKWEIIEDYGRTLSGMRATAFTDVPSADPGVNAPCLEYGMHLFSSGEAGIRITFSPTLNFLADRDLKIGLSLDEEEPRIVVVVPKDFSAMNGNEVWEQTVMDNARFIDLRQIIKTPGYHTLKIWMIDPGVVIEKIVVNTGGVRPSYLGPPESKH